MRVLHLASWYPNKVHLQLGNFVRRHIDALPRPVESTVLHAWPAQGGGWLSADVLEVQDGGVRTLTGHVLDFPPRRWRVQRAYDDMCRRLQSEGYQPDLVHLHIAADAAESALSMAAQWNVPLVVSENWTAYHPEHGRSFRKKEERAVRAALSKAAMHLPVSQHLGRAMARYGPQAEQRVIPNVVASCFRTDLDRRQQEGPLRLLHVSSMVDAHKNIRGMLRALARAVEGGADVVLDCWGGAGAGGQEIQGFQTLAQALGIAERVCFCGPASESQVAEAMQGADGFVLFSQYENLPCVLLEAWSCGLPVIATDVGGVGEHLGGPDQDIDLGVLLQPEDEAGLSAAVESWAQRKAGGTLPDALAISAYAQARFTPEAVGGAILDAYRAVLA